MENNKTQQKGSASRYIIYAIIGVAAFAFGGILFHTPHKNNAEPREIAKPVKETIWTCSMHPQIRMHEAGKCPICGMDLIPLNQLSGQEDTLAIRFTKEAAAMANVMTSVVSTGKPVKEVRLYGKIGPDERLIQSQVSHLSGRIEKLFVNFTGEQVIKGQKLAEIYSPELVTAQQELLETYKTRQLQPELYEASREKLRQWKLTDSQISSAETSGTVISRFDILSNTSGTVTARKVNEGDYINQGMILFEITDLSRVWVLFDAYETDLPFLKPGEKVGFSSQAIPGTQFSGNIDFIDPAIDPMTRVAKVRVEASNLSGKLKPGLFISGIVSSSLDLPGNDIIVPRSAILWTGRRSIVYVKQPGSDEPVFKLREVTLGLAVSGGYIITSGLSAGEEIVTNGTFSVDAAAQLEGKPSMMNPRGGQTPSMPGMVMPGDSKAADMSNMPGMVPAKP